MPWNLEQLLSDPRCSYALDLFARRADASENLDFLRAVRAFRLIPDPAAREIAARKIVRQFIGADSQREVNLESQVQAALVAHSKTKGYSPGPGEFGGAERYIEDMLQGSLNHRQKPGTKYGPPGFYDAEGAAFALEYPDVGEPWTLEQIAGNDAAMNAFRDYLGARGEDNKDFVNDVVYYRAHRSKEGARRIFAQYLAADANKPVTIPAEIRDAIAREIPKRWRFWRGVTAGLFDPATNRLMADFTATFPGIPYGGVPHAPVVPTAADPAPRRRAPAAPERNRMEKADEGLRKAGGAEGNRNDANFAPPPPPVARPDGARADGRGEARNPEAFREEERGRGHEPTEHK